MLIYCRTTTASDRLPPKIIVHSKDGIHISTNKVVHIPYVVYLNPLCTGDVCGNTMRVWQKIGSEIKKDPSNRAIVNIPAVS